LHLQKRESGAQALAEAAHAGAWDGVVWAHPQPNAFSRSNNEVGIILLGEGLQTIPSGVRDHLGLPF
jgi:hypothetical protein